MRCATVESVAVFTDASASSVVALEVVSLQPPGAVCTATQLVLLDEVELSHYLASPFKLTPDEAGAVALAVAGVWMVGWIFRVLIGMLRDRPEVVSED